MPRWTPLIALTFLLAAALAGCQASAVSRSEFDGLSGRVDTLENVVIGRKGAALASGAGPVSGAAAAPPPGPAGAATAASAPKAGAGEKSLYSQGQSLLKQKKFASAAETFSRQLVEYPGGSLAPNARYWLGECSYAAGRYQEALADFQRCVADYPSSRKAPDALLKTAYCYDRLGDGPRAMTCLDLLLKNYPSSDAAAMVKSGRSQFKAM